MCDITTQGHYNGPCKRQQNGGRKSTLNNNPGLRSEGIMMDHLYTLYCFHFDFRYVTLVRYIYVSVSDKRVHLVKSINCGYGDKIRIRFRNNIFLFFCENRLQIISRMFSESEIVIRQLHLEIRY